MFHFLRDLSERKKNAPFIVPTISRMFCFVESAVGCRSTISPFPRHESGSEQNSTDQDEHRANRAGAAKRLTRAIAKTEKSNDEHGSAESEENHSESGKCHGKFRAHQCHLFICVRQASILAFRHDCSKRTAARNASGSSRCIATLETVRFLPGARTSIGARSVSRTFGCACF